MEGWDADTLELLTRRVWDVAGCNASLKVYLNDQEIKLKNFAQYVQLYRAAVDPTKAEEKVDVETITDEQGLRRWEVALALSDGELKQVSFVNSISTSRGGTHVQYIADKIVKFIQPLADKKSKGMPIKPQYIKNHLWVFVNCLIDNPEFDSQSKETLKTKVSQFGSKCELSEKFLKKVSKSGLVELVLEFSNFRGKKELGKVGGGKKKRITGVHKLVDANNAGTKKAAQCTLILTEGDSAKALAVAGMSVVGRDNYGVFPLRGKPLNVRDAKVPKLSSTELTRVAPPDSEERGDQGDHEHCRS